MRFQVPQNIDLEDKVIGPLTLKQFIILVVGGMFDYMWYTLFDTSLFILFALPTTVFTIALVFFKVQDQPFPKFLSSLALYALKPKVLTWGLGIKPKIIEGKKKKKEEFSPHKLASESQIQKLAQLVDTQGWGSEKEEPSSEKAPSPAKPSAPPPKKLIVPNIAQPQPFKVGVPQKQYQPSLMTKPKPAEVKKVAREVARENQVPQNKALIAAKAITQKLKTAPAQEIKPKDSLWKRIIHKLAANEPQQPAATTTKVANAKVLSPEDIERELGLTDRVKTHEVVKPNLNLNTSGGNQPDDILEKTEK